MERGQTKTISISWVPPADFDVGAGTPGWAGRGSRQGIGNKQICLEILLRSFFFQPDHPLMVSTLLQLRGDVKETYKVIFVAYVVAGL